MKNEFFGTPPSVDNIQFDPKHPCDNTSGYHITKDEVSLISGIVMFLMQYHDLLRSVDLSGTLARLSAAQPIDDMANVPVGDGIFSLGPHTSNPTEDLETIAKITKLMSHIVNNVAKHTQRLKSLPEAEFKKELTEQILQGDRRKKHLMRNVNDDMHQLAPGISRAINGGLGSVFDECGTIEERVDLAFKMARELGDAPTKSKQNEAENIMDFLREIEKQMQEEDPAN